MGQKVATYPDLARSWGIVSPAITSGALLRVWSPDSRSLASAGQDGHLHVWDARTGQDRASYTLQSSNPDPSAIAWSSDGSMIAFVTPSRKVNTPVSR